MRPWYFDKLGLIVQRDGDSGDTAQRVGMWGVAVAINQDYVKIFQFEQMMEHIEIEESGIFWRSPTPPYNTPNDFSRDQQTSIACALGFTKQTEILKRMMWQHVKRLGKYQNIDFASPAHWAIYARGLGAWYLWPLFWFSDIFLVIESLMLCDAKLGPDYTTDDLDHVLMLLQARFFYATPVSWLARWIYAKWRPYGGPQRAFSHYFREETGANPFDELFKPIIAEYILK